MKPVTIKAGRHEVTLARPPADQRYFMYRQFERAIAAADEARNALGETDFDPVFFVMWSLAGAYPLATEPMPAPWDAADPPDIEEFGRAAYRHLQDQHGLSFSDIHEVGKWVLEDLRAGIRGPSAKEVTEARDFTPAQQDEAA